MLHEEFTSLSKVEVSSRFYTSLIEPEYMARNDWENKEAFCNYWLKNNKASIVKANIGDLISLTTDAKETIAIKDAEIMKLKAMLFDTLYKAS